MESVWVKTMPFPPSVVAEKLPDQRRSHPMFWQRRICWLTLSTVVLLIIALTLSWQVFYQQTGMVMGRPLASSQNHLHTVVFSSRPGVVYLGTHFGLFASIDGGHTWPQHQGALSTAMITAVAVSPTHPDLLAVVAVPTTSLTQAAGVYVSADAGQHWHFTIPPGLSAAAYPLTLQAASGAAGHFYVFYAGISWFETRDLGQHWSALQAPGMLQNPTFLSEPFAPAHLLSGGDQGLLESWDDGQHWQRVIAVQGTVFSLVATQPSGASGRAILCATEQGLYRGLEQHGKITWSRLPGPSAGAATRMALSADGSALYVLYGSDLWFSADQGSTWRRRWHFMRGDLVALVIDPQRPQEVLAGFFWPGLVLNSANGGSSWQTLTS